MLPADRVSHAQIVNLSDIFTGRLISEIPPSLRSLCTSLLHLPHLTSLDLSDNAFGGRSVEPMYVRTLISHPLAHSRSDPRRLELLSSHPGLQILKLNNNGMGPTGGATIAGALLANANKAKAEGRQPALRTIVCGESCVPH